MAYEDGAIYALLDGLSLEARDVNRYILEATLDGSIVESSASASIAGEASQVLADAILSPTNYVEVDITLGDAWVLNPRIGSVSHSLESASLDSSVDTIANYLSITLARATLSSAGTSSGDILVATLDDAELSSLATAMGGSLQSTLGELSLLSALVGTMSAELSSTLADGTLSGVGALEQSGETSSQLEGLSTFSSEADIALEGVLASTLSNVTKSLASGVVVDAEMSANFGDLTAIGNGFTATSYSPYQQIVTWSGHPASGQSVKTRLGNLTGITGNAGEFGLWAGEGWTGTLNEYDKYLVASSQGVEAHNIDIKLYDGTNLTIQLDQATPSFAMGDSLPVSFSSGIGLWMGKDGSDYKFRIGDPSANRLEWTGSLLSLYGAGLTLYSGASEAIVLDPSIPAFSVGNPAPSGFSTGSGLWTGITAEGYKFRLGDPSGARLEWESAYGADPSRLSLYSTSLRFEGTTGHIALTQDAAFDKLGSLFVGTGLWEDSTGIWGVYDGEVQVNIDAVTGQLMVAGGSITLNSSGINMLGGVFSIGQASDFTTGTGVWIGELPSDTLVTYSDGQAIYTEGSVLGYQGTDEEALAIGGGWAFRIGDPTADRLEWDGISLNLHTSAINLVEGATVGNPTIYFKEAGESVLFTVSAQETSTNTLAALAVTEFNSKPTKLALDASIITFSHLPLGPTGVAPSSDYQLATKKYVDDSINGISTDASGITYTPLVLADWNSSTDPGNLDDALNQLAERVTDTASALAGLSIPTNISELAYTPAVLTDWDGNVDPGNAKDALDQLAERVDDGEIAIAGNASDISDNAVNIALKANDADVVHDAGDETVAGIKTFSSIPVLPASNPTSDNQAARKAYVDSMIFVPSVRVGRTTDYSLSGHTWVWFPWQSEEWDNNNMWSSSYSTRLIATTAGWYYSWGVGRINTTGGMYVGIRKNGSAYQKISQWGSVNETVTDFHIFGSCYLAVGDYLELGCYVVPTGTFTLYYANDSGAEFGMERKA